MGCIAVSEMATEKCKDLVNMAVAKARLIQPLEYLSVDVTRNALVIGGVLVALALLIAFARGK